MRAVQDPNDFSDIGTPVVSQSGAPPQQDPNDFSDIGTPIQQQPNDNTLHGLMNNQSSTLQDNPFPGIGNWFLTQHPDLAKAVLGGAIAAPVELAAAPALAGIGLADELGAPTLLARLLGNSAAGAASTIPTGTNPLTGAALGGGFGAIGEGVSALTAPGNVAKYLGGTATPEQVAANQAVIPTGAGAPAGNIINSPSLQRAYEYLGIAPFSGASKPYDQYNNFLQNSLSTLSDPVSEDESLQLDDKAFNDMSSNYENAKQKTANAYDAFNSAADSLSQANTVSLYGASYKINPNSSNPQFDTTSYDNGIQNALNLVNKRIVNKTTQSQYSPITNLLNDYQNTPINNFQDATALDMGLNDLYRNNLGPQDSTMRLFINKIKDGLGQSMDDSASQFPQLNDLYQQAKQARTDQSIFERNPNGQPTQFFKMYGNPLNNSTNNFIKKSVPITQYSDNSDLMNNFMSNLSPDGQAAVRSKIMAPPSGQNPITYQVGQLKKLNNNEQSALFGTQNNSVIDQIQGLSNTYPKGITPGTVPYTGAAGSKTTASIGALFAAAHQPYLAPLLAVPSLTRRLMTGETLPNMYLNSLQNAQDAAQNGSGSLGSLFRNATLQSTLSALPKTPSNNQEQSQ